MSILNKNVSKKMSQTLKRRFLAKLPWVHKRAAFSSSCSYEEIPAAHTHQEEMDENLANEALEARLMELIANAPQKESHVRLSLHLSCAVRPTSTTSVSLLDLCASSPFSSSSSTSSTSSSSVVTSVQTRCLDAQAQSKFKFE